MSAKRGDGPSLERHLRQSRSRIHAAPANDDEIALRDIVVRVWRGKWIIALTVFAVVGLTIVWMKSSAPKYTASMVVAAANDGGSGGLSSRLNQVSGLAALAGIDLASTEEVRPFTQFTEIITSQHVAERLQKKYSILPKVFARQWKFDPDIGKWTRRTHFLSPVTSWAREFFGLPPRKHPTPLALADYLDKKLTISVVGTTGMRRIEFQHKDPKFAMRLLEWVYKEGDSVIREEAEARTSRQIDYIERKLRTTTAADHRRSLVQLLLDQERQMMMIQVDLPFAVRTIEPPMVSDDPTFPKPPLFIAIALIGGVLLGIFMVFLVDALRGHRDSRAAQDAPQEIAPYDDPPVETEIFESETQPGRAAE